MTDEEIASLIVRREQTLTRLRAMLVERLRLRVSPDDIDPDVPLFGSGLGLDSIDAVELVVGLQNEFGVRLPENRRAATPLRTVNTLVDFILANQASSNAR